MYAKLIYGLLIFLLFVAEGKASEVYRKEVLKSGLTCYFVKTTDPCIDYYLIQNTGSALERTKEDGLAHFIEHLSFLSTRHFDRPVGDFLSRNHVDNNASTYQDKIVYYMKGVPVAENALNDSCLLVLHDWCGFLSLVPEEVEKEKNAIVEEWRGRRRFPAAQEEYLRCVYNNTRYARLSSLGDMDFIRDVGNEQLRSFCREWFSPGLAAIVIKGNIDVDTWVKKVELLFGDIQAAPEYVKREQIVIPANDSVYFKQYPRQDGQPSTFIATLRLEDKPVQDREEYCRERFYSELYNCFMAQRLERTRNAESGKVYDSKVSYSPLIKGYKQLYIELSAFAGHELSEFRRMMSLHYDLLRHGLAISEIDELKSGYTHHFLLQDGDLDLVKVVEENYLCGYPLFTGENYNQVVKRLVADFDNEAFARFCRERFKMDNLTLVSYNPRKYDRVFTRKTLLDLVTRDSVLFTLPPLKEVVMKKPLSGGVWKEENITGCGAVLWTLDNGLKVIYRQTDNERVELNAYRAAGWGQLPVWDKVNGLAVSFLADATGTTDYNREDLQGFRFKYDIDLQIELEENRATVRASVPAESFGKLLQLLHLRLNDTYFKESIVNNSDKIGYRLSADAAGQDEYKTRLNKELFGIASVRPSLTMNALQGIKHVKLQGIYDHTFKNADGWLYVITGNINADSVKYLVSAYLGSLPKPEKEGKPVAASKLLLKQDVTRQELLNTPDDNGGTDMNFVYGKPLTAADKMNLQVLTKILRNRYNRELRDVRAAIYGMYLEAYSLDYPVSLSVLNINFGSKKGDQESIARYIDEEFSRVAGKLIPERELEGACKMIDWDKWEHDSFLENCRDTWFVNPSRLSKMTFPDKNSITEKSVQRFARKYYDGSRTVRYIFK